MATKLTSTGETTKCLQLHVVFFPLALASRKKGTIETLPIDAHMYSLCILCIMCHTVLKWNEGRERSKTGFKYRTA